MRNKPVVLGAEGLVLLLLCGSVSWAQDVRYNYVPGTDFRSTRPTNGLKLRVACTRTR